MKNLRKRTFCNGCKFLCHEEEVCGLGIKIKVVKHAGFHVTFKVDDKPGCRAARQNRLHEESR